MSPARNSLGLDQPHLNRRGQEKRDGEMCSAVEWERASEGWARSGRTHRKWQTREGGQPQGNSCAFGIKCRSCKEHLSFLKQQHLEGFLGLFGSFVKKVDSSL